MKDLRFIKHATDSYENECFEQLLEKEGMKGYGVYWVVVENLFGKPGYRAPISYLNILAGKMRIRKKYLQRIVTQYGLFKVTKKYFSAPQLAQTLEKNTRKQLPEKQTDTQTNENNTATITPQNCDNAPQYAHNTETISAFPHCNTLKMRDNLDRQDKRRKDKKKNTLSLNKARGKDVEKEKQCTSSQTPAQPVNHQAPPPPGASTTQQEQTALTPEELSHLLAQLPLQKSWIENLEGKTPQGTWIRTHIEKLLPEFESYLYLTGEEKTVQNIEDAKRRFFFWTRSRMGKETIGQLQETIRQSDPYRFEQLIDGKRFYYGYPIPDHAPPRPDDFAEWDEQAQMWTS